MKLFKSLLVAPATLGLLAPMSATANEVTINDFNPAEELAVTNSRVDGLEARLNNFEAGGFSETTTASFSVDASIGAVDGDSTSEKTVAAYQFNIGLSTSFTGEDSLDIAIDSGSDSPAATADDPFAFDTGAALSVDGVAYSFPVGGLSMLVGFDTDISSAFTGACTYSAFTDYMGNCGTDLSYVAGGGVTAAASYAFDSGFSLAGGVSGQSDSSNGLMTKQGEDYYGLEAAYTADSWGIAVAYASDDNAGAAATEYLGVNANYSFDVADLSVGFESESTSGSADKSGYFIGLTFPEVGPGSVSIGAGTSANYTDAETEYLIYEAAYSYPVNDGMTITPGVFVEEKSGDDLTGIMVKSSFSF